MTKYRISMLVAVGLFASPAANAAAVDHAKIRTACAGEIEKAAAPDGMSASDPKVIAGINDLIDSLNKQLKSELRHDLNETRVHRRDAADDVFVCVGNHVLSARKGEPEGSGRTKWETVTESGAPAVTVDTPTELSNEPSAETVSNETAVDPKADTPPANANGGPLGLKGANPAQTGALAPATEERYFLKGRIVNQDAEFCGGNCPPVSLQIIIHADDVYGSRRTGSQWPADFTFGPPMTSTTHWRIETPVESEFYKCGVDPEQGGVPSDERAINVGFAIQVTVITCGLNAAGRARVAELDHQ